MTNASVDELEAIPDSFNVCDKMVFPCTKLDHPNAIQTLANQLRDKVISTKPRAMILLLLSLA